MRARLRWIAFAAAACCFFATLNAAPWSVKRHPPDLYVVQWRPVWDPPYSSMEPISLKLDILAVEWLAIAGAGAAAWWATRKP